MKTQNYVYIKSEESLYTAGFYDPMGQWNPESDHATSDAASKRVSYLNGNGSEDSERLDELEKHLSRPGNLYAYQSTEGWMFRLAGKYDNGIKLWPTLRQAIDAAMLS
jgi:hypothetical protein